MNRGMAMLLTLLVLAAALFAGWYSTRRIEYFPDGFAELWNSCLEPDGEIRPQIVQDEFYGEWFEGDLAGFREPSLFHRPDDAPRSVRFLWLRSFHDLMVVRIDDLPDGHKQLIAKRRPGGAGYTEGGRPGRAVEMVRRLDAREANQFDAVIRQTALLSQPNAGCSCCLDGAQWIIEVRDPEQGYRYRRFQSPQSGLERDIGLAMLGLTGWDIDPVY